MSIFVQWIFTLMSLLYKYAILKICNSEVFHLNDLHGTEIIICLYATLMCLWIVWEMFHEHLNLYSRTIGFTHVLQFNSSYISISKTITTTNKNKMILRSSSKGQRWWCPNKQKLFTNAKQQLNNLQDDFLEDDLIQVWLFTHSQKWTSLQLMTTNDNFLWCVLNGVYVLQSSGISPKSVALIHDCEI